MEESQYGFCKESETTEATYVVRYIANKKVGSKSWYKKNVYKKSEKMKNMCKVKRETVKGEIGAEEDSKVNEKNIEGIKKKERKYPKYKI